MNLASFVGGGASDQEKRLDAALGAYFQANRRYRATARRDGAILIVDLTEDLYKTLKFVVDKCDLSIAMYHLRQIEDALTMIADLGAESVRAVVIDYSLVSGLPWRDCPLSRIAHRHPSIPVWVHNCGREQQGGIQGTLAGVFEEGSPLRDYIEALGLPERCKSVTAEI